MKKQESAQADTELMRQYREDAVLLLRAVRETLADLLRQLIEGEGSGSLRELTTKQAELESALKRVFEAEAKFHDWIERIGGTAAGTIDLDAARAEIGRRLDRLRSLGGAG